MQTSFHLDEIAKLMALRMRLDPLEDFELWFWAGMTAGTHAVNAALHEAGITSDAEKFPMQPGVYLMHQLDGSLKPSFSGLGDILHVGRPKIDSPTPQHVAEMMREMEIIEQYRDPYVREGREATNEIVANCKSSLERCLKLLHERLPE